MKLSKIKLETLIQETMDIWDIPYIETAGTQKGVQKSVGTRRELLRKERLIRSTARDLFFMISNSNRANRMGRSMEDTLAACFYAAVNKHNILIYLSDAEKSTQVDKGKIRDAYFYFARRVGGFKLEHRDFEYTKNQLYKRLELTNTALSKRSDKILDSIKNEIGIINSGWNGLVGAAVYMAQKEVFPIKKYTRKIISELFGTTDQSINNKIRAIERAQKAAA
jgi:transcription initiation factor TFIIIB Brf1 subunit/transcription initiation factor TFIIB